MARKIDIIQQSFAGGQITEALQNREDLAKQQVSVKVARNMIVTSTGSMQNRGGFKKIARVGDSTNIQRLLPFVFSADQTYALMFGNGLGIIKDGVLLLRDIVDAAYKWTLSGSGTAEYYLELAAGGDPELPEPFNVIEDGYDMIKEALGDLFLGEWGFGDNDTLGYDTIYVRLGDNTDPDTKAQGYVQTPLLFDTPYSDTQVGTLDYAQSADVVSLTTGLYPPYKTIRSSDTSWSVDIIDFQDGPYHKREDGDEDITFTPSAKTGSGVTVEISESVSWPSVGLPIRLGYENPLDTSILEWGWGKVASIVDADTITVDIEKDLGYEYLLNPKFKDGRAFWEDRSTGASSTSYDSITNTAELNQGASGTAWLTQQVTVNAFEQLTFEITVDSIGGGGTLRVNIGNTALASDVLPIKSIVAPGTYSYTTIIAQPTGSTVHITLSTFAGAQPYTHKVSATSLMRKDLATSNWRRGEWNSDFGWPEHVALFEQAFWFGNISSLPDTMWKTKTGEFESFPFNTPLLDTDSVNITLANNRVNAIQWMEPFLELVVGTTGDEWRIQAGANSSIITPTSINAKPKSKTGSASIKPIIAGNSLLFLNRNANKIFVLTYSFDADGYKPSDVTVLAPDLLENHTITEWAYQETPNSIIWCVRDDGVLLGFTYIEEQEIWAWTTHDTQGTFESVTVIPEGGVDVLYVVIRRNHNGVSSKFVEKLMTRISDEDIYDYFFVDSGVTLDIENDITPEQTIVDIVLIDTKVQLRYNISPLIQNNEYIYISNVSGMTEINNKTFRSSDSTSLGGSLRGFYLKDKKADTYIDGTQFGEYVSGGDIRLGVSEITGLGHLRGREVSVLADGSRDTATVVPEQDTPPFGGKVALKAPSIVVHAGLPITSDVKTLPHDFVSGDGSTSQGKKKSLSLVNIYFNKTGYAKVGTSEDGTLSEVTELFTTSEGDAPPPLQTGIFEVGVVDEFNKLTHTFIRNDKPFPMEIMGIISKVTISEG